MLNKHVRLAFQIFKKKANKVRLNPLILKRAVFKQTNKPITLPG